jgi:hypothetical protein
LSLRTANINSDGDNNGSGGDSGDEATPLAKRHKKEYGSSGAKDSD